MSKKVHLAWMAALCLALTAGAAAQQKDNPNCKDHPLFPKRMPNYSLEACKTEDFGVYEFWTTKGPKVPVEGRFTFLTYAYTGPRGSEPSGAEVVRNYENALRAAGATILGSVPNWWVNGKLDHNGQEVYAQAERGNGKIWIRIVEQKAMQQHVVADAAALSSGIRATGHVAVYGVLFDTDSAAIKPESAQALGEIAKLLKSDPALKVFVVGHTDTTGAVDHNLKLSQERAQSVTQALARDYGIAPARMRAFGCGPFAPVASNGTEEGRAKNRRVELVQQ